MKNDDFQLTPHYSLRLTKRRSGIELHCIHRLYDVTEPIGTWNGYKWIRTSNDRSWLWRNINRQPKAKAWMVKTLKKLLT